MPESAPGPAAKLAAAVQSLLGHITGHGRSDIADPYLLRISKRAWVDLGEDPSHPPDADVASDKHEIVAKFYKDYSAPGRIDTGTPIGQVADPKFFRIRAGDWRAACRYAPDDGVQWLCRALPLAKFHVEDDAYVEFGGFEAAGTLFPDEDERRRARGDQFLIDSILSLKEAMGAAENQLDEWFEGYVDRPNGESFRIGRALVEHEAIDDEGAIVTRYVLLITAPPDDVEMQRDWKEVIAAHVFPGDEPVLPPWGGLPAGTHKMPEEFALMQQMLEEN